MELCGGEQRVNNIPWYRGTNYVPSMAMPDEGRTAKQKILVGTGTSTRVDGQAELGRADDFFRHMHVTHKISRIPALQRLWRFPTFLVSNTRQPAFSRAERIISILQTVNNISLNNHVECSSTHLSTQTVTCCLVGPDITQHKPKTKIEARKTKQVALS